MLLGEPFETLMNAQARLASDRAAKLLGNPTDVMTIKGSFLRVKHLYNMNLNSLVQFASSRFVLGHTAQGLRKCPCDTVQSDQHWPTCQAMRTKLAPILGATCMGKQLGIVLRAKQILLTGAALSEEKNQLFAKANEILNKIEPAIRAQ